MPSASNIRWFYKDYKLTIDPVAQMDRSVKTVGYENALYFLISTLFSYILHYFSTQAL